MVKMPSLDELKKMGSGLIDSAKASAKTVDFTGMVDKVMGAKTDAVPQGEDALKAAFQAMQASLRELTDVQNAQAERIKKLESQLVDFAKRISEHDSTK